MRSRSPSILERLAREWSPALDAIDDMACILAIDGTIVRCNPKMASFLGLQDEELKGRKCYELMHGARVFFPDCPFAEMRETGRRETLELPLGDRWYRVTADPLRDGESIIGAVHLVRDVTDFREAVRRAEDKSSRMKLVNDLAVDLAARPRHTDLSRFLAGRLRSMTDAVAVAFNEYLPAERILATRAIELRPGLLQVLMSPLLRRLEGTRSPVSEAVLQEVLSVPVGVRATLTEASFGAIPRTVDASVRRLLDVDRFLGLAYVVEGELYGTSVLALQNGAADPPHDLVEAFSHLAAVSLRQERAERDAAFAAAQLDSFFELSTDILGILRLDGTIARVNPAWRSILGWEREEVEGRLSTEFVHPDDRDRTSAQIEALREGTPIVDFANRLRRKDGVYREIEWRITPQDGQLGFAVGRDVTARTEAEERIKALNADLERRVFERTHELAAANRELEELVYSVAHDLRTPLRAVDGFSLAVLEDHWEAIGDDGRGDLQRVRAAAQTMGALIDALLSLTRVTRQPLTRGRVDLSAVADRLVAELREADPTREVQVEIAPGLAAVSDEALVSLVLQNLLGNAWKFTSRREIGHIEVGRSDRDGTPTFYVRDDGVGFDPAYAGKLFSPFQRLHPAGQFPGRGVGLATVARALERLGGSCRAEGAVGSGATFSFTLGDGTPAGPDG